MGDDTAQKTVVGWKEDRYGLCERKNKIGGLDEKHSKSQDVIIHHEK